MENNNVRPDPASSDSMGPNVYSNAFRSWQAAREIFDAAVKEYATACATFEAVCVENPVDRRANHPLREQVLAALEPELPQIASSLEQVTNAAKTMKALRNRSATLVPINRLSSELLIRIFESLDHPGPLGPTLEKGTWPFPESVACVSTSWRQLTFDNGQLWSRINFDLPSHLGDKLYGWAATRLKRSQGHRVELCVRESPQATHGDFKELLDFLPGVMPCLSAIRFRLMPYYIPEILSCWFTHGTHDTVIDLQLIVDDNYSPLQDLVPRLAQSKPVELIEDRFSHVRYLSLHHAFVDWSSRLYHGLVELDLLFTEDDRVSAPIEQLASVLAASPMLRALKLCGLRLQGSSSVPESVRLDNLEILFLANMSSDANLLLPILQPGPKPMYMRLPLYVFDPDPCLQFLMRSRVEKLIIEAYMHDVPPPALFTVLPVTQHLVLVDFKLPVDFFLSMNFPLARRDNSSYPTVWPHLRSLHLVRCWFPNDFPVQVIQHKTPIPYPFAVWTSRCIFEVNTRHNVSPLRLTEVKNSAREQPIRQALRAYLPGAQGASDERSSFQRLAEMSAFDAELIKNPERTLVFLGRVILPRLRQ